MTHLLWIHPIKMQQLSHGALWWPVPLTLLVLALAATGCSNRNPAPTNPVNTATEKRGDWFCQPAAPGATDPWECVQDKGLAKNPKPDRLPNADNNTNEQGIDQVIQSRGQPRSTTAPINADPLAPTPLSNDVNLPPPDDPPPPPGLSQLQSSDPPASTNATPAQESDPASSTSTTTVASASNRSRPARPLPDYIRLAYQPAQPVPILELPSHYYAVQLAAMTSAREIQAFIAEHQLHSLTAAKVAINNKIRYVMILGIYTSRDKAELAAAGQRPAPLKRFTPWIRKLSNLQKAMHKAEQPAEA